MDDPADADLILFVGGDVDDFSIVLRGPLPMRYPRKTFVCWDADGYIEVTNPYTERNIAKLPERLVRPFWGVVRARHWVGRHARSAAGDAVLRVMQARVVQGLDG